MLQLQELSHSPTRRKSQTKKATFDADSIHINLVVSESQSFEVGTSNPWLAPPFERSAPPQNANLHPLKVSINNYRASSAIQTGSCWVDEGFSRFGCRIPLPNPRDHLLASGNTGIRRLFICKKQNHKRTSK